MILVIGATGWLGGMVVDRLIDQGKPVRALVRRPGDAERFDARGVESVFGDLKDPASLERACQGADTVITTANSAARGGDDNVLTVDEQGNRDLIDAARRGGVSQFVFTSALGSDRASRVPFLRAKALAEQHLKDSGLTFTILMPNLFMEIWCPNIVGRPALGGEPVTLVGEGRRMHSMISIEDVASFAVAAVGNPLAYNRVLLLGGPEPVSWHDVIAVHERVLGRRIEVRSLPMGSSLPGFPDFISGFMNALETYDSVIDMGALSRAFGVTQVSLEQSVRRQLAVVPSGI
jgi:uncharacterized protein YbjT (DUF2867 family)